MPNWNAFPGVFGMIRLVLAAVALSALALQAQPMPMAMPGKEAPPAAKPPAPLPTSPTMPPPNVMEEPMPAASCSQCCSERVGLFRRLLGRWCGPRHACCEPTQCCSKNTGEGNWCPVISTYVSGSLTCGEKCRHKERCGLGLGRFIGGRCEGESCTATCPTECMTSTACRTPRHVERCGPREKITHAVATPYHSPVRYYFTGDPEPECPGGECGADGDCRVSGHLACGRVRGGVAYPAGCMGGVPVFGGREVDGRLGLVARLGMGGHERVNHNEYAGAPYHKWFGRKLEACYGLAGSPFNCNIRFARDERPTAPPINAGKPYETAGMHSKYSQAVEDEPQIQQAGLTTEK